MKRTLMMAGVAAVLLSGCGVDKDGTADNLIEELEKAGQEFTAEQKTCIKDAVKSYDDDELRDLSENKASDELAIDFSDKITACIP
jgi:protein involved in sex pheromone biosynthesis